MPRPISPIIRINSLYNKLLDILEREVDHIDKLNIAYKLEAGPAKDMREYLKLMGSLKEAHANILSDKKAKKELAKKELSNDSLEKMSK